MARFLFVVPPLAGHVNPTVTLGAELTRRGHDVAWAGPAAGVADRLAPGQALFDTNPELTGPALAEALAAGVGRRGMGALKSLWQDVLLPLGRSMLPGVAAAVADHRPDLVICDQQALAGAVVAVRGGLGWVTSATTSAEMVDPLGQVPLVDGWVRDHLQRLQTDAGVAPEVAAATELRRSPLLTIAYTTPDLVGPKLAWPAPVCWIGPAVTDRVEVDDFPWDWLDPDRRAVLVSLGTLNGPAGRRFFAAVCAGLAGTGLQVVCVAPPGTVADPPPGVLVRSRVPQLALLRRVAAVVCHAGHNTVCESLAAGVPLVLAPIRDDQPIIAEQVETAGAGIRVRFGRVRPEGLAAAVTRVLDDPGYRLRARRIGDSFAAAGGAPAAAARLEQLVRTPARSAR